MAHSNETQFYHLPLYSGSDIINPLTDFNNANEALDTAMHEVAESSAEAKQEAHQATEDIAAYGERIAQCETDASEAYSKASDTQDMIASPFDPLKEGGYAIGDSVIYAGKLYTFINPHTGTWDAGDVISQPITDAVKSTIADGKQEIEEETAAALAEIAGQTQKVTATQKMIAPAFDATLNYANGDCVTYADKLYQFNANHTGAWTGTDVDVVIVENQIAEMKSTFTDGVDTIVDAIEEEGVTLSESTPSACATGIHTVATNKYNSGRSQGRKDVKSTFIGGEPQGASIHQELTFDTVAGHYYFGIYTATQEAQYIPSIVTITSGGSEVTEKILRDGSGYGLSGSQCYVLIEATSNHIVINKTSSIPVSIMLIEMGLYQ